MNSKNNEEEEYTEELEAVDEYVYFLVERGMPTLDNPKEEYAVVLYKKNEEENIELAKIDDSGHWGYDERFHLHLPDEDEPEPFGDIPKEVYRHLRKNWRSYV